MTNVSTLFPVGCFVWLPWRRVWYLTRVEEVRDIECGGLGDVKLLVHVHGEPFTKDKWLTVHRDGSSAAGTPPLRLLQVLPTALTGIGSLPAVGNCVQLLIMDHELVQFIASRRTNEDPNNVEVPTLVGIVVKVLPARDASVVDVAYPSQLVGQASSDEAQWQRVQIGNGYLNAISESRFVALQQQLVLAIGASMPCLTHLKIEMP
ncbi:hypothetical protein PHYPSEUDO_008117 [Phytophthora pseudosyringae]|uniref:Uncharacterized protein n=1 Tax=Phytophthora pseudosyringae TaxID=221518 RepID=A0A8T1VF31_9STRA|nr:hypothetical protein PHYPSEUDO_008117 [Phytophthora pseudosyringae]